MGFLHGEKFSLSLSLFLFQIWTRSFAFEWMRMLYYMNICSMYIMYMLYGRIELGTILMLHWMENSAEQRVQSEHIAQQHQQQR